MTYKNYCLLKLIDMILTRDIMKANMMNKKQMSVHPRFLVGPANSEALPSLLPGLLS